MRLLDHFEELVWNPTFWLPPNETWKYLYFDNEYKDEGYRIPQIGDIFTAWKLVPLLFLIRYISERHLFVRVAAWAGLQETLREKPPDVDILEEAHRLNPKRVWKDQELTALSKRLDSPKEQIEEWFRARKIFEKPTKLVKFCESAWKVVLLTCLFVYGLHAHWTKEWFWNFKLCWENFPQPVSEQMYWYFIISLANYSCAAVSHYFWDVQRRDPGIMMFHHLATFFLFTTQWILRVHRLGLMISLFHDVGELWLEISKCLTYLGLKFSCKLCGIIFTIVWIVTRNIILPFYLIPSVFYYSPLNFSESFPFSCLYGPCNISSFNFTVGHMLMLLLSSLALIHVYWTWNILRIMYLAIFVGKFEDENVSDVEGNDEDDADDDEYD